jgi:hypothetical protein
MGFSRITDITRRMAPFLALEMGGRGKDSWGATNAVEIIKYLGPIHKTWAEAIPEWSNWTAGIFHTRAATTGAVSSKNQHPFITTKDTKVIIGIHNGVILNHDALNKKYNRTYECDSPHIFEAIVGNSPTQELQGYGNLAWYEMTAENPEPRLHLARFNGDNLNIAALESGEIVFCSTRGIVEQAASMAGGAVRTFYPTDGDMEYDVRPDETDPTQDCLWKLGKMPFGNRNYGGSEDFASFRPAGHQGFQSSQSSHRPVYPTLDQLNATDRSNSICAMSSCTNKVHPNRQKALICEACKSRVITQLIEVAV